MALSVISEVEALFFVASLVEYNGFSVNLQMPHLVKFVKASLETTGRLRHQNKVIGKQLSFELFKVMATQFSWKMSEKSARKR